LLDPASCPPSRRFVAQSRSRRPPLTAPPLPQRGSGGYHRPSAAAAALTSALYRPGWTTAVRVARSIRMVRIFSVDSVIAPSTAVDPPDRLVPAPRVMIGTRFTAHHFTVSSTSAVVVGR